MKINIDQTPEDIIDKLYSGQIADQVPQTTEDLRRSMPDAPRARLSSNIEHYEPNSVEAIKQSLLNLGKDYIDIVKHPLTPLVDLRQRAGSIDSDAYLKFGLQPIDVEAIKRRFSQQPIQQLESLEYPDDYWVEPSGEY